jgi:hypothetical protein
MTRLTLTLAVWLGIVSMSSAALTQRKDGRLFGKEPPQGQTTTLPTRALARAVEPTAPSEFAVTEQTEVLLNGKPCRYADVPRQAGIQRMELAPDNKTVLKIHFRVGK